jgi:hypothetical protein
MAVPVWQPGTLYSPGDIVQPITAPAPTSAQAANGDFSAGATGWDFTGGAAYASTGGYSGNGPCVQMPGSVADGLALNQTKLVIPTSSSSFEASAMINQGAAIAGATKGWVEVRWYDEDDGLLSSVQGNIIADSSGAFWKKSTVTATRPSGAAYARAGIGLFSVADHTHPIFGDSLTVSGTFAGLPEGLVYKAVQEASGYSASTEPAWPPILGQTVIDNDVIWEAESSTRVTWEASPLYVSGAAEPTWPTAIDGYVVDGSINWKAVSRRVEDENCPNSKFVVIAASKVYALDDDIARYCATVNPLDWTTENDAGYIPIGLQNYGSNPFQAMGLYRGNLIPFNAEGFQLWQVDEDPASIAFLDALPMGSTQHHAIAPVSNDLFFLSSQGVRTVGIAASSTNFQAGDVGMPIDPLVKDVMANAAANGVTPIGLYYPSAGQYWLAFSKYDETGPSISGSAPDGDLIEVYPGYTYAVTPGSSPIKRVFVSYGALPYGLTFEDGVIEPGSPTIAGTYAFKIRVEDENGLAAVLSDSIDITLPWYAVDGTNISYMVGSKNGADWNHPKATTPPVTLTEYRIAISHNGKIVLMNFQGKGGVTSDSGATWTPIDLSSADSLKTGIHDGTSFIIVGNGGSVIWSDDGTSFTQVTVSATGDDGTRNFAGVAVIGSRLVAVQSHYSISTDHGRSWSAMSNATWIIGNGIQMRAVASSGVLALAAGDGNRMATSPDGENWSEVASPFAGSSPITVVSYSEPNGTPLWVLGNASGQLAYGPTPSNMAVAAFNLGSEVSSSCGAYGRVVIGGTVGRMAETTNGRDWNLLENPSTSTISAITVSR